MAAIRNEARGAALEFAGGTPYALESPRKSPTRFHEEPILLNDIATFQTLIANATRRRKAYNTQRSERNAARKKAFDARP